MLYRRVFLPFLLLFAAADCFSGGNTQKASAAASSSAETARIGRNPGDSGLYADVDAGVFSERESSPVVSGLPEPAPDSRRAEQVMKALAAAYPDRIGEVRFKDGDWAVRLVVFGAPEEKRERWYYYAGGRILPDELREKAAEYDPQPFYNYPADLPPWKDPSPEDAARMKSQSERRRQNPPRRSQHFFDDLWRAHSRDESWDRVKSIRFLGHPVMIHYSILEDLAVVEERILAESKTNPQVRQWIGSLNTLDGWNWRSIAETRSRSFHAYGAALDLLPKSLGGRETYWLWAARRNSRWWTISYDKRFHPPDAVIRAFEAQGFIWGGKWLFFDTMHFEYRPEIFVLNDLPLSDLR
ncbi:MAG: M15 family metallopeptidase [Treponema sp.]|nr:M15 family metallopeptidase [Treponema sp.]